MHTIFRFFVKQMLFPLFSILLLSSCAKQVEKAPIIFYPPPPDQPKLQFLTSISSETDLDIQTASFENFLLGPDISFSVIGRPYDVASSRGKIYVIDRQSGSILITDLVEKKFLEMRTDRLGVLQTPSGIWVSDDDIKYVADLTRRQVIVFDADNNFKKTYGSKEIFNKPVDVAVYKNRIYVCDMDKGQIFVLDKDSGELILTIGKKGVNAGELNRPTHITVDSTGNIFVNDAFNFRVQQFDTEGKFVKIFGFHGSQMGGMARTKGVDIDRDGHLYVADAAFERVQIFNREGQLLLFFGGPGTGPGNLILPAGIHIDYENVAFFEKFADKDFKLQYLLYVCNMSGPNKINVYGFGEWTGEEQ